MPSSSAPAQSPRVRLRVHLATMGYDVQRVVAPVKELRADVVLLLTEARGGRARTALERTVRLLRRHRIQCTTIECNIWDPPSVVDEVGNVVTAVPGHEYLFNVSTGARTACIGGTIASMFWPVRPYYQPVGYEDSSVVSPVDAPVTGPPVFLPTFAAPTLDRGSVETLRFLVDQPGALSKRQLMAHMRAVATIFPRSRPEVSPQALHAQTNVVLRRLVAWGFVTIEGRGRRMQIRPTEMGRGGARMFRHLVEPRPVPALLRD